MKQLRIILILIFAGLIFGGAACPQNFPTQLNYSEDGKLIAGRKCEDPKDGQVCCTSIVPYQGKTRELSACYPVGQVPDKEEIK